MPDEIPWDEKKKRNNKMLEVQKEISLAEHQKTLGKTLKVLVEGPAKLGDVIQGRTEGDQIVFFKGGDRLIGQLVDVKIQDATALSLMGEVI